MLDIMWSFDSAEEYLNWYHLLDAEDQDMADVLQRMIILETMDEMLEEVSDNYTDIKSYLKLKLNIWQMIKLSSDDINFYLKLKINIW